VEVNSLAESAPIGSRCGLEQSPDALVIEATLVGQPASPFLVGDFDVDPGFGVLARIHRGSKLDGLHTRRSKILPG
jgi:hypothetical protein